MAFVLDAFAPYLKKLIADMADQEVRMLLGVSSEIKKLEDNMESLEAFLVDAEKRRITDKVVQIWVRKLKDGMYDATDILDLCQLQADKWRGSKGGRVEDKAPSCGQSLLFCLQNPLFAHKVGKRIKELNQRLDNIYKEADKFKFNVGLGSMTDPRMLAVTGWSNQKMTSEFNQSAIVGEKIEKDTKELGQLIISDDKHELKVVSIVGAGGMGKTTLAQKIFNDRTNIINGMTVQEHFKLKIWLSITQHFDEVDILRTAIKHAGGDHGGEQEKTLLTRTLTETLSMGRFLLVLDDVWSDKAWSCVLSVPVRNASHKHLGNWVLMTSRFSDLAHQLGASFYQHHVSPLDGEDAWSLLNKQLPPTPSQVHDGTDHLKDVGMKIISKCGGLPLAIKVMGGLLSTKSQSEGDWEAVMNHRAWSVAGLPQELDNTIYLSYEHLSPQLKQCFLYCSLFPKGTTIQYTEVIPMWISEGFIHPPERSSSYDDQLEEIADGYYQELIKRNLIDPTKEAALTGNSCTMHDVVRSFAEFMSKEESLVVQDEKDGGGSRHSHVRRLSIGSTKSELEWDILQNHKSVRTLIINQKIKVHPSDSLRSLSTLRLLYLRGTDCDRFVDTLCQLRLRYLHLENTNISSLPGDIYRMKFLQHIVVDGCPNLEHLPSCITQLLHLRTLSMFGSHDNVLIPKVFGQLTNLRSLYGFRVHLDENGGRGWCSLEEIGPLSQLRKLTLYGLENVSASSLAGMAMMSRKEHLDYLGLFWSINGFMGLSDEINKQQEQRAVEDVFEKLRPPSCIQHLRIEGYFGSRLPNWMMVPATQVFKSLKILRMNDLGCCTQLPNGLCQLPTLEKLAIKEAPAIKIVGPEFQSSSTLSVGGGGVITARSVLAFPNLKTLHLAGLCEWEEWNWEMGEDEAVEAMAMPCLMSITIENCKLSCLPSGLSCSMRLALRCLNLYKLCNLTSVENFHLVVELEVSNCPRLKRINGFTRLQKISIIRCRNIEVLDGVPSLDSMEMEDGTLETIPEYVAGVTPRYLKLTCSKKLHESLSTGCSSEYDKISHIKSRTIEHMPEEED